MRPRVVFGIWLARDFETAESIIGINFKNALVIKPYGRALAV